MANKNRDGPVKTKTDSIVFIKESIKKTVGYILKDKKQLMIYLMSAYIGNKLSYIYENSQADNAIKKIMETCNSLNEIFAYPIISLKARNIIFGIMTALSLRLLLYIKMQDKKNFRKGEEYGSASFGTHKDIEPFIDSDPYNNIILSQTESLSMNTRMKDPSANRNKNVLIVGGSGSGKTRGHVKPNLMQTFGSYIVTDPKGYILRIQRKYVIKK